jgi:hypothetical protein
MTPELRIKLEDYCKSKGWSKTKEDIKEILSEAEYNSVKEYGYDEHRWYTTYNVVVKVGDIYIDFESYSNSGDEDALCGEGGNMAWDSAVEVFPKEVTITDYVTADKL